jgi:hypothetical protein
MVGKPRWMVRVFNSGVRLTLEDEVPRKPAWEECRSMKAGEVEWYRFMYEAERYVLAAKESKEGEAEARKILREIAERAEEKSTELMYEDFDCDEEISIRAEKRMVKGHERFHLTNPVFFWQLLRAGIFALLDRYE